MIEHNSKLARDPNHLRRLVTFWPEENIVQLLAKQALADMERETVPAGWKLVPIDPTEAMMLHNSSCQHHAWDDANCPMLGSRRTIWNHMIEAVQEGGKMKYSDLNSITTISEALQALENVGASIEQIKLQLEFPEGRSREWLFKARYALK